MKERDWVQTRLEKLSLEEKASLMSGENFWNSKSIEHLDIPSFMLTDGPHGLRKQGGKADHLGLHKSIPATCFPTAATLANSWDVDLLNKVGTALGKEASAENVSVLLGPGMNIKRNPLNGRNFEYFSEDPLLTGKLASSMIHGIQSQGVAACAKHFAVNSQEYHRMNVDEIVDTRALHELYLEAFRIAVEEGQVQSIMTAYNKVNGVFANESDYLLNEVLQETWKFKGLVVTDWGGNNDRVKALKAGNHLEMPSTNGMTDKDIVDAVKSGNLAETLLDQRVEEFLEFVYLLKENKQAITVDYKQQHQLAIDAARRSIVLLKNENKTLPLDKSEKLLLVGDFMETPRYQGAGSSLINPTQVDSLLEAFQLSEYQVTFEKGYHRYGKQSQKLIDSTLNKLEDYDKVLVFVGLDESSESEGVDRKDMKLPQNQLDLIDALVKKNRAVVVILAGGAAVELPFAKDVEALLHSYLPGQGGGAALFDVLNGDYNPSGKLSESYPYVYEDTPSSKYYPGLETTSEHRESIFIGYRYFDTVKKNVRYPFGFGLSYTNFEYSNLTIDNKSVKFTVKNTGDRLGEEVAQVYLSMQDSKIVRAFQELIGFEKVSLKPGESKEIVYELKDHHFEFYNADINTWDIESGTYEIRVGGSSKDIYLSKDIEIEGTDFNNYQGSLNAYQDLDLNNLSRKDFENLLNVGLPSSLWDREKNLGINDMIKQSQYKSLFGKFINGSIISIHKILMKLGRPHAANNVIFAQNLPFRGLARMSGGKVDMDMLDGILLMSNGHFFKGIKHYSKSYFSKKREDKRRKNQ